MTKKLLLVSLVFVFITLLLIARLRSTQSSQPEKVVAPTEARLALASATSILTVAALVRATPTPIPYPLPQATLNFSPIAPLTPANIPLTLSAAITPRPIALTPPYYTPMPYIFPTPVPLEIRAQAYVELIAHIEKRLAQFGYTPSLQIENVRVSPLYCDVRIDKIIHRVENLKPSHS